MSTWAHWKPGLADGVACPSLCLGLGPDLQGQQFRASPVLKSCLLTLPTHPKGQAEQKDLDIPASRLRVRLPLVWGLAALHNQTICRRRALRGIDLSRPPLGPDPRKFPGVALGIRFQDAPARGLPPKALPA